MVPLYLLEGTAVVPERVRDCTVPLQRDRDQHVVGGSQGEPLHEL